MHDKTEKKKKLFIYGGIFLAVQILYNLAFRTYFGDDYFSFSKVLANNNLMEWLKNRYEVWSSRVVIEAILVFFSQNVFIWKLVNILVSLLLAYSLYRLSHGVSLFAVFALVLTYPVFDMGSAGWIATFLNYYWPLTFGLYSLIILDKLAREEEIRWWEIILSFAAACVGTNVEQYCAAHIAILILFTIRLILSKKYHGIWMLLCHYFIAFSSLLFIILAPGNEIRKSQETASWMKDFCEKTAIDKLVDGFERTFSVILSSSNILFLIFAVLLFACVWKKTNTASYRIIGGFPLVVALSISFGKVNTNGFLEDLVNHVSLNSGVTAQNWVWLSSYLPLTLYGLVTASIIMAFFVLFDEMSKAVECSFIFFTAIGTGIVMGFSPTMFISDKRTMVFFYFLLIVLILKLLEYSGRLFSEKEIVLGKSIMSAVGFMVVLNNIVSIGRRFVP